MINFQRHFTSVKRRLGKTKTYLRYTFAKKRNQRRTIYIGLTLTVLILFVSFVSAMAMNGTKNKVLLERQKTLQGLSKQLGEVKHQKQLTEQQKAQKEAELQKQIDDLNKQLQAKKERILAAQRAVQTVSYVAPITTRLTYQPSIVAGCGDNSYANYVYMHESGCNTAATNAGGCFGIGQDCNGIVRARCGTNYACQNSYFNSYVSKYGGWGGAYSFWLSHHWY